MKLVGYTLSSMLIILVLASCSTVPLAQYNITVEPENSAPYDRDRHYGGWRQDDCKTTRTRVLIDESLVTPELDAKGCKVIKGKWIGPFTNFETTDPGKLDIDHLVPLAEAHRSGANLWTNNRRKQFANDLTYSNHLIAVKASENRNVKSDNDLKAYIPDTEFRCEYVRSWFEIKEHWGLAMDAEEYQVGVDVLKSC